MGAETRRLIEQFWALMNANDWEAAALLLHERFTLEYPQSGDRFRGRAAFLALNAESPAIGRWSFAVRTIVASTASAATEVVAFDEVRDDRILSFFEVRGGLIWRMIEYWAEWPEPFVAPAVREGLVPDEVSQGTTSDE
jgi:hypothetical protein